MLLIVCIFLMCFEKIFLTAAPITLLLALERLSELLKARDICLFQKKSNLPLDLSIRIYLAVSVALGIQSEI